MNTLNIGLVGYGFMGRTHSNAFHQAPHFFDLPCKPVLKAVAALPSWQSMVAPRRTTIGTASVP